MKATNIKILNTVLAGLCVMLCSCGDFLDETPKGTLIPKTTNDFGMILDDYTSYNGNYIGCGEILTYTLTDDVKIPDSEISTYNTWGLNAYRWDDVLFNVNQNDNTYNRFYHVIYLCNYILENIEGAKEGSDFSKNYVEGAARLHRAFSYFTLVNLYAKQYDKETASTDLGVPLETSPDIDNTIGRATVQEVYDLIIDDATKAAELLDDSEEYPWRPTAPAANALLARISLFQGDYAKAWQYARKARLVLPEINDYNQYQPYSDDPEMGIDDWSSWGYERPDLVLYKGEGYGPSDESSYYLSDDVLSLFDKDRDLRYKLFITTYYYGEKDGCSPRTASYLYPDNRGIDIGEVYLTEAEGCVREGDVDGALTVLNALRVKRYAADTYTDITERDPDKLLELILQERRRELMFKGIRWFDLKRLNKEERFAKTVTHELEGKTYTLEPNSNKYALPFPENVLDLNKNIEQNPR